MTGGEGAIRECRRTIAKGSKSFALASLLLPQPARDHAAVIYTFCRRADDAIDEAPPAAQPRALERLRAELDEVYGGGAPAEPTLAAFTEVVRATGIPRDYPGELLAGMEMDVLGHRYRSLSDLLLYGYRVASTVGLMMCHVMGVRQARALTNAAHLGIAMQLTNICRDVAEDWERSRLYLPDELLARHGLPDLHDRLGGPLPAHAALALAPVIRAVLDLADRYYQSGDDGLAALPVRCALAVRAARLIYSAIGERIERTGCDLTAGRAVVATVDKLRLIRRAVRDESRAVPARLGRWLGSEGRAAPLPVLPPAAHVLRLP